MLHSTQENLRRRLAIAIVLPIVLLLLLSGLSLWQITRLLSALRWVDHTDQVIAQANRVQKLLLDMETGNRGYLLTKEQMFLAPYQQASAQIGVALNELKHLVADNPSQVQRADEIQKRQRDWNRAILQTLRMQQSDPAAFRSALLSRKQEMDAMRSLIADFIEREEQLRNARTRAAQQATRLVIATSAGLAVVIGVVLAYASGRQLRKVAQTYTTLLVSLEQSYTLLQAVIDGTTDAIFMKDRQGNYRLVNTRTAEIFGRSKADILGKDDSFFLPPDMVSAVQKVDATVIQTGRPAVFEEQILENGEIRTFLSTKDPYVDAQGNIAGVISIARDITDRKIVEEQIQRATRRLIALQEIERAILSLESPAAIAEAALSRLSQVVKSDQAAVLLFNLEQGELEVLAGEIGGDCAGTVRPITDNVSPEVLLNREAVWYIPDLATCVQRVPLWERLLTTGYHSFIAVALLVAGNFTGDLLLTKRQPNSYSAEDLEVVREVANQLALAIQQSQLRDQLQRHATELEHRVAERTAELEAINQELEAFTYSVSHDLRAPLRTMQGFAQALIEDYGDQLDDIGKSYIHSIVEDAMQMSQLIADLLAYSRLSRTQISLQTVDLNAAIVDALKQLTTQVQEKQAKITIAQSLPPVLAHRSTLIQVLVNLLSNALKFVESGMQPQVKIYTKEERHGSQNWVKLYVEDNGIGIAPEHQERIFRVFERLHGVESYPGTGIGLAIVRKGLERMGGNAGVESLGHGSRFWIALPKVVLNERQIHDATNSTATH